MSLKLLCFLRMVIAIFFLWITISCATKTEIDEPCNNLYLKQQASLSLSFSKFDQRSDDGWRPLYLNRCYEDAANLIVKYIDQNPELSTKHPILAFHAGQMFAMSRNDLQALYWMKKGYSTKKSKIINWNAFVDANIAFITNNLGMLEEARRKIFLQPTLDKAVGIPNNMIGKKINLDVVDGFLKCFDKTYLVAYKECRV